MNCLKTRITHSSLTDTQIGIWYLGQVGFIFKYKEKYVLVDGYLSDYVDKNCSKLIKWERKYAPPITGKDLDFIDYIFCTHGHCDHADPYTLSEIAKVNTKARVIVPEPIRENVINFGFNKDSVIGAIQDREIPLCEEISVMPIPAAHEELHYSKDGTCTEMGFIFKFGDKKVFHSGDCCPYDGLEERVNDCDVMLLPVNGRDYYRRYKYDVIGNFTCTEAVTLAKEASCKLFIPMHYDLYDCNGESAALIADTLQTVAPSMPWHSFVSGEGYIFF